MVMTIIQHDNLQLRGPCGAQPYIVMFELVYADDTMLLASSGEGAQRHLACAEQVGKAYGLELNLDKTLFLTISGEELIVGSDGAPLQQNTEAVYLGGLLSTDGRPVAEVTRRLGEARRTFRNLQEKFGGTPISPRDRNNGCLMHAWSRSFCTDWNLYGFCGRTGRRSMHSLPAA